MKKTFHHNGRFICEYESTGDALEDIKIVDRIIKDMGLDGPEIPLHRSMFYQAQAFSKTAAMLYERLLRPPPDPSAMSPFVVNMTFAIEIYLKALAEKHGKSLHGHEIETLFRKLPAAAKAEIDRALAGQSACRWRPVDRTFSQIDLQDIARNLNTAFVDWRYHFEKPDKLLNFHFPETIFLAEMLHNACIGGDGEKTAAGGR